ncbi:hypothetical protein Tco_0424517 [Tanacetum coccineum]
MDAGDQSHFPRAYYSRSTSHDSARTVNGGTKDSEEPSQDQMIELQTQQGPAKDPAEPELPEEASSSS